MPDGKPQTDFLSIFYSFFNSATTFGNSMKEYEQRFEGKNYEQVIKETLGDIQGKNSVSVDKLIDSFVPEKYQPVVRVAKNWPWPQTVDLLSAMLKEYGKDGKSGYKTTGDVVRDIFIEKLRDKLFQR